MRILYVSARPPYPFFLGGAVRCAHQLLRDLAQQLGQTCMAAGGADYAVTPWSWPVPEDYATLGIREKSPAPLVSRLPAGEGYATLDCGYPVGVLPDFRQSLEALIDDFRPDLVWAQLEGALVALQIARRKGVKGLYFVHDAEFDPAELRTVVDLGCSLVASSHFLAAKALVATGQRAHVVHPPMDLFFDTRGDAQGFVTLINAHKVKGLDTFLELAQRLPHVRFLLQESWKLKEDALAVLQDRLAGLPNVTFRHRVSDMRQLYRQTRLLLAPSVWEEGFGMVAVEAQSCGIPVIASARGGLPESVGDGGLLIKDYRNVDAWVAAVESVLGSAARYAELSGRALAHARSADFSPPELARRFLTACQAPAPGVGGLARGLRAMRRSAAGLWR
ncbi:MAG TPA: glycosyltransferase [Thiobacillaceae bacterium]|nr:glycosyltransferase [Thiobacillaceae bacterium]HNU64287.1 glycosyltransferase [Thiobacillaceae bacterium]